MTRMSSTVPSVNGVRSGNLPFFPSSHSEPPAHRILPFWLGGGCLPSPTAHSYRSYDGPYLVCGAVARASLALTAIHRVPGAEGDGAVIEPASPLAPNQHLDKLGIRGVGLVKWELDAAPFNFGLPRKLRVPEPVVNRVRLPVQEHL